MIPLLPFAAGIITGAVAVRLLKTDRTRKTLHQAGDRLRDATVSSLEGIENTSARARRRLARAEAAKAAEGDAVIDADAEKPDGPAS
ncbi:MULTISPECIES: hypothetical protein [unclassified Ectothiorhodospira]|uniref:hypothetical protein n=1 Tax=unclassified Ectothiorhodospira TaxID=2684909 RepID=UPI001EE7A855|nr:MULTISPECIES: hypothetical protein [unclassified Ectothiorhodospira]MCG5517409.1 hypothetical protein [Ectothiorhodospira sp. 9100]MCG5520317.1 hypothetical protein [Ectothiorhodospira sp. 9905]